MYVPFHLATVVDDDDGQRGHDEEHRPPRSQTPPTPPVHAGSSRSPPPSARPKFAWFLFEYHSHRFESLDLPQLPADRSDFDVHGALLDDKVQNKCHTLSFNTFCP